jgi:hypothetical protein
MSLAGGRGSWDSEAVFRHLTDSPFHVTMAQLFRGSDGMSGQGLSYNRTVARSPGSFLEGGAVPHHFAKDGGPGCFTTTTTMRWLPAALREGGLV